ncbi:MAG: hypothetical protein AB8E82_18315 [Aureispira sp.]
MKYPTSKKTQTIIQRASIFLLLPCLFSLLFAFKSGEPSTNQTVFDQSTWTLMLLPDGASSVADIAYFGNSSYIATNKGLYKADRDLAMHRNSWQKIGTKSSAVTDLQVYKEGSTEKELIVLYADNTIGRVMRNSLTSMAVTRCSNTHGTFNPKQAGKVPGTDNYFMMNAHGEVKGLTFGRGLCNKVVLKRYNLVVKAYSYTYANNNKLIFGSSSYPYHTSSSPSWNASIAIWDVTRSSTSGLNSINSQKIADMCGSNTSNTAWMSSTNGYIYKTTNGGSSWAYYSHGFKPYDNNVYIFSMTASSQHLYIGTKLNGKYVVYYSPKNTTQADWKSLGGLPGWRNSLTVSNTPTTLVVSVAGGGVFKRSLK